MKYCARSRLLLLLSVLALLGPGCTFVDENCDKCECDAGSGGAAGGSGGTAGDGDGSAAAGSGGNASAGNGGAAGPEPSGAGSGGTGIAGAAGAAGAPAARLVEGDLCMQDTECWTGLSCVTAEAGVYAICARSCETDSDCDAGEECITAGRGGGRFCSLRQEQQYQLCGAYYTSHCSDAMRCVWLEPILLGVCYVYCDLAGDPAQQCESDQVCATGIIDSDTQGVCGTTAARGEPCDVLYGVGCETGDICIGDVSDPSTFACRQLCSASGPTCEQGTCTQYGITDEEYVCI